VLDGFTPAAMTSKGAVIYQIYINATKKLNICSQINWRSQLRMLLLIKQQATHKR
jgi:hypothetical protein